MIKFSPGLVETGKIPVYWKQIHCRRRFVVYQKLILEEFPEIRFAHPYTTAHYDISFPAVRG